MKKTAKDINADLAYLFNHINWGASNIDARSAEIMNTISKDIVALEPANKIIRDKKKKTIIAAGPKAIAGVLAMLA